MEELEQYRIFKMTSDYWAEANAIAILEKELNPINFVKILFNNRHCIQITG